MADLELTRLTSVSPLTKTIHLNPDGSLSNDSSNLALYDGKAARLIVPSMAALASVLDTMPAKGALTLGTLRADLPDDVVITTEAKLSKCPNAIARNLDNFKYQKGQPGFVLLDHDRKQMPEHVRDTLDRLGGFEAALASICPGIRKAGSRQNRRILRCRRTASLCCCCRCK